MSCPSSVSEVGLGAAGIGRIWNGEVGWGEARWGSAGRGLETVDRVLATVPLRVLVWSGTASQCGVRQVRAGANVAAIGLVTVLCSMQKVHQLT